MEEMQKEQFSLIRLFLHAHEQSYRTALEEVREEKKEESLDLTAPPPTPIGLEVGDFLRTAC